MDQNAAKALIETYIEGWLKNDKDLSLSVLSPEIIIGECHGPTVSGRKDVGTWMQEWIDCKGQVLRWDILTFFYSREIAVYEWEVEARVEGHGYQTFGISLVTFRHDEIASMREYCKTKPPYSWKVRS
jgi:hypothetical protein